MAYRNGNYVAFYVAEPFGPSNLGAYVARDFVYYQILRAWKASDRNFPFVDSHEKTYNVRDGSDWESTLKPRLRARLRNSKNIVLFLSSSTKASRALIEEIEYGVGVLGLPMIVAYPELDSLVDRDGIFGNEVFMLWGKVPAFERLMDTVPTLHILMKKECFEMALQKPEFMVQTKCKPGMYRL
jgi:hypothetical protein